MVNAAPSYPARMAFRIMLKTGLRVSEALALRRVDLRLDQHPPIIVVAGRLAWATRASKGREVPVPADLGRESPGPGVVPQRRTITSQC